MRLAEHIGNLTLRIRSKHELRTSRHNWQICHYMKIHILVAKMSQKLR